MMMDDDGLYITVFVLLATFLLLGALIGYAIGDPHGSNTVAAYVCQQYGYGTGEWLDDAIQCGGVDALEYLQGEATP